MKCVFENCDRKVLSKSLCNKHYYFYYNRRKRGIPLDWPKGKTYNKIKKKAQVCTVDGCLQKQHSKGYCIFHYIRKRNGVALDRPKGLKGELNHNWQGGVSQYPDHWSLKRNRKIKIEQENGKCEVCKRKGRIVHHLDNSKTKHAIENLKLLCDKCHKRFHRRKKKTSVWIRRYGMTSKDLGKALRCSYGTLVKWHKSGDIAFFLGK